MFFKNRSLVNTNQYTDRQLKQGLHKVMFWGFILVYLRGHFIKGRSTF